MPQPKSSRRRPQLAFRARSGNNPDFVVAGSIADLCNRDLLDADKAACKADPAGNGHLAFSKPPVAETQTGLAGT
jgi:hypothetical protein